MVQGSQTFNAMENSSIELPESSAFADMEMSRDGQDLVLQSDNGQDIVIQNYFTAEPQPVLEASDGSVLTPELVSAFVQSPEHFTQEQLAQIETAAGTEPVGAIEELHGNATVTRADGSSEPVTLGTPIYQGDVVETSADGGVNILFIDETSMALSEGARFAVTDYSFDAQTESGTTNFSVLRGVFVFTSGLIGRDDPDDVTIDTPVGSIGIRGTIIAGHINPEGESSISVVEGAIVIKNGAGERTLSEQFETIRVDGFNSEMQDMGVLEPAAVTQAYGSASYVIPSLFSNINDTAKEQAAEEEQQQAEEALEAVEETQEEIIEEPAEENLEQKEIMMEQPLEMKPIHQNDQKELEQKEQQHKQQQKEQQQKNEELRKVELQNPDTIDGQKLSFGIQNEFSEIDAINGGGVAARLTGAPNGVNFTFNDTGTKHSADGNFQIIGNQVHYIGTSLSQVGQNTDFGPNYVIKATGPEGKTVFKEFNPVIHDIAVNLHGGGEFNAHNLGLINAGDMNHDGHDDFAFINGSNVEIVDTPDGTNLHTFSGAAYKSVTNVGDLNNDGYEDLLAGSPSADPSASPNTGGTALINGTASAPTEGVIDFNAGVASITGDNYGHSISGAGDFNGDGKLDYAVGATGYGANDEGAVYIHAKGITTGLGHDDLLKIYSSNNGEKLGDHVDGIGDFDGDGYSDMLIGGDNQDTSYVILGQNTPHGSNLDVDTLGGAGFKVETTGHTMIAGGSAGDFNGDGFDDFAISITQNTLITGGNVQSYVVFGGGTIGDLNLNDLENPNIAFKINDFSGYDAASDYVVRSVGDMNGDGFDDIEVGSGTTTTGFHIIHGGIAGNAPYASDNTATDANGTVNSISASADGQSLIEGIYYDDNAFDNVSMVGNHHDNTFLVRDETFRNIDGGEGFDAIRYGVSTGSLDFSNFQYETSPGVFTPVPNIYERISGIDALQFTQDNGATMKLTVDNIFDLLKTSDDGTLKIENDGSFTSNNFIIDADSAGTVVGALQEGTTDATVTDNGSNGTHTSYSIGGYTLYIDDSVLANTTVM